MAGRGRPKKNGVQGTRRSTMKTLRKKGPTSSDRVAKSKSMAEAIGVEALSVSGDETEGEGIATAMEQEAITPRVIFGRAHQEQEVRSEVGAHQTEVEAKSGKISISPILHSGEITQNLNHRFGESEAKVKCPSGVKIDMEDIQEEIDYWDSALVCYVLGANIPFHVFDGFANRMWKDKGLHKVGVLAKGIHIVRFTSVTARDEVLHGGYMFFDKKPVIMKAWDPYTDFTQANVCSVATWIQIPGLDLRYWGERTLFKIVGQLGTPLMLDEVTKNKELLNFPRVMIEVQLHQSFPDEISFTNELNQEVVLPVKYEWLPIVCDHCFGMGHKSAVCKKKEVPKQAWVVKKKEAATNINSKTVEGHEDDGFQQVTKGVKGVRMEVKERTGFEMSNNFGVLIDTGECSKIENEEDRTQGGGEPPLGNG
ncbi:uncharacterized protein LOC133795132 [Humulus lupulus]|uniref:uncharacterized protein LOC133795132 n=1 Tax=Humulus lupulus TaxID=3486 RepID=UPI002B414B40|nr:uncharacterized protein LOC133795132 [Humulus lupulus]